MESPEPEDDSNKYLMGCALVSALFIAAVALLIIAATQARLTAVELEKQAQAEFTEAYPVGMTTCPEEPEDKITFCGKILKNDGETAHIRRIILVKGNLSGVVVGGYGCSTILEIEQVATEINPCRAEYGFEELDYSQRHYPETIVLEVES